MLLTRFTRCALGVCSLNNKLYVLGGSDPCGQKGLKNCDTFDPVTKEWTSCAPLNTSECLAASPFCGYLVSLLICTSVSEIRVFVCIGRHQAAVCELDGYMYVIGGAESWNCLNSVERYNPENNTWNLVAPMNVARRGAGVGIYAGKKEKKYCRRSEAIPRALVEGTIFWGVNTVVLVQGQLCGPAEL